MGEITTEAGKVLIEAFTAKPSEPDFAIRISESSVIRHAVPLIEAEAVAAERERIANLLPRFMHGEMFDETPESDLDLDATAFAMGERFRFLIGAYPYREGGEPHVRKVHAYLGPISREDVEDFYGGVAPEGRTVL